MTDINSMIIDNDLLSEGDHSGKAAIAGGVIGGAINAYRQKKHDEKKDKLEQKLHDSNDDSERNYYKVQLDRHNRKRPSIVRGAVGGALVGHVSGKQMDAPISVQIKREKKKDS